MGIVTLKDIRCCVICVANVLNNVLLSCLLLHEFSFVYLDGATTKLIRVQKYIEALTSKTKPKLVLVCMIYYPDETNVPSWASPALGALSYNSNPQKLQLLIRKSFVEATSYV